jgi:peptidoglycan/xylan/chitin deacetylase (PgdA/CDA1 family)
MQATSVKPIKSREMTNKIHIKEIIVALFLSCALVSFAQQKKVCFSIDDLPVVSYGISDSAYQTALFHKLVFSLHTNKVPAIGFVNESKLYNEDGITGFQAGLLKYWITSGLELGNHSFSHPDYNTTSFADYTADIIKGETITKKILNEQGRQIKYFRHPFLHVGNTKAKADSLTDFLNHHNYTAAPVTIDNDDYLFALAYKRAADKEDTVLMNKIGRDYITYIAKKLTFFEEQSDKLFGRKINQILLIHASLLNSVYMDSLIALFKANNYIFVSMDEALTDPAYKTDITVFINQGISWLDRWALSAGKKGDFFKSDPITPAYIVKLAE